MICNELVLRTMVSADFFRLFFSGENPRNVFNFSHHSGIFLSAFRCEVTSSNARDQNTSEGDQIHWETTRASKCTTKIKCFKCTTVNYCPTNHCTPASFSSTPLSVLFQTLFRLNGCDLSDLSQGRWRSAWTRHKGGGSGVEWKNRSWLIGLV